MIWICIMHPWVKHTTIIDGINHVFMTINIELNLKDGGQYSCLTEHIVPWTQRLEWYTFKLLLDKKDHDAGYVVCVSCFTTRGGGVYQGVLDLRIYMFMVHSRELLHICSRSHLFCEIIFYMVFVMFFSIDNFHIFSFKNHNIKKIIVPILSIFSAFSDKYISLLSQN